ncbi:MAG: hypothetical protein WCJ69_17580 [Betaproteobacteria bacterium]
MPTIFRTHDDVGRAVASRALELQHDLAPGVVARAIVGECGGRDGAAQPSEFLALVARQRHRGVQAEAVAAGGPAGPQPAG